MLAGTGGRALPRHLARYSWHSRCIRHVPTKFDTQYLEGDEVAVGRPPYSYSHAPYHSAYIRRSAFGAALDSDRRQVLVVRRGTLSRAVRAW
eukprot:scaffold6934_cov121-Isochrysis_galbana.AAC.8